jgi:heme exporter protein D
MSLLDRLDMGKYALYVWGSFGATALLMTLEPILLRNQRRALWQRLRRMARLKAEEKS